MMIYKAERVIDAPAHTIWAILMEGQKYQEWDPSIIRLEGEIALGEKIKVFTHMSPDRAFPVAVTEITPDQKMVWTGGMPLGLFKGVRTFTLVRIDDSKTTFKVEEVFTGPLLPLMRRMMPDLTESFESFADGLKARAESQ